MTASGKSELHFSVCAWLGAGSSLPNEIREENGHSRYTLSQFITQHLLNVINSPG